MAKWYYVTCEVEYLFKGPNDDPTKWKKRTHSRMMFEYAPTQTNILNLLWDSNNSPMRQLLRNNWVADIRLIRFLVEED